MPDGTGDRAIVVGIARYPEFGAGGKKDNDLQGPVKDANDVADWLKTAAGAHVTLITSEGVDGQSWQVQDLRPNPQDIENRFQSYVRESSKQAISRIGRRLYIYMAGHGFSPEPRHLCLITADAFSDIILPNIQATSWVDWFADQTYFDEFVLWMDCCATRTFDYEGGKPLLKKTAKRATGRGKVFMAFAAGPSRAAFEGPIGQGGEVRGLFTDRLLHGLKGAAAIGGTVWTSSLIAYLRNQSAPVGAEPVSSTTAGPQLDPKFPETAELELARIGINVPGYMLAVDLPDGTELEVVVQQGGVETVVARGSVMDRVVQVNLGLGIYKARAPGLPGCLFEIASGTGPQVRLA